MYMRLSKGIELFMEWDGPTSKGGGIEYRKNNSGKFTERELWLGRLYVTLSIRTDASLATV